MSFSTLNYLLILTFSFLSIKISIANVTGSISTNSFEEGIVIAQGASPVTFTFFITVSGLGNGESVTLRKPTAVRQQPSNTFTTVDTPRVMFVQGADLRRSRIFYSNGTTSNIEFQFTPYPNMVGAFSEDVELINNVNGSILSSFRINITVDAASPTTSIVSIKQIGISVFPNPCVGDNLTIEDKLNKILTVSVMNSSGSLLYTVKFNPTSFQLQTLSPGVYILRFGLLGGEIANEKLVIE